jgi:predicted nucleotidyltransferase
MERHRTDRIGWLRAAVLGANDGIVSTASLVLGVAAADATHSNVLVAGIAGLVAGAMSMAAGEYVSVRSQADSEQAALNLESAELEADDQGERRELTAIYVSRGVKPALARQVAEQLMAHDALGAHARDELGISDTLSARPIQAAVYLSGKLRRWRGHAAIGCCHGLRVGSDSRRLRNFPRVPRGPGRVGCARGRRECGGGRNARHVLGRTCHGADGRRRGRVRSGGVNGDLRVVSSDNSAYRSTRVGDSDVTLLLRNRRAEWRMALGGMFQSLESHLNRDVDIVGEHGLYGFSEGFWKEGTRALDEVQDNNLDLVCQKLRLSPGDKLIKVGSGWGYMSMLAREKYGADATGYGLVKSRNDAMLMLMRSRNFGDKLTLVEEGSSGLGK